MIKKNIYNLAIVPLFILLSSLLITHHFYSPSSTLEVVKLRLLQSLNQNSVYINTTRT